MPRRQHALSSQSAPLLLPEPQVSREFALDSGERDAEGLPESASWHWLYRFDFGERAYEARVYSAAPELAFVSGPTRW
jgi:hypothetical protein